jgi:hypothetical protein
VKTAAHTLTVLHLITAHYPVIHAVILGSDTLSSSEEDWEAKDNLGRYERLSDFIQEGFSPRTLRNKNLALQN